MATNLNMNVIGQQQLIDFNNSDENIPTFINNRDVIVYPSTNSYVNNSFANDNVQKENVENKYIIGNLVAYHAYTRIVAYVLSISETYMIRVLNNENSSRFLIKGANGEITDISFSRSNIAYIASIDITGTVMVNKIVVNMATDSIDCVLMFEINVQDEVMMPTNTISYNRVIWCGCSEEVFESDASVVLGVIHGRTLDIIRVEALHASLKKGEKSDMSVTSQCLRTEVTEYASKVGLIDDIVKRPYLWYTINVVDEYMTCLAISNDAASFAVAINDGTVHFIGFDDSVVSGLRKTYMWRPFTDDVVWSLIFIDDCHSCDGLWRHVVVGSAYNRQLKLFRYEYNEWHRLQTVTFTSAGQIYNPCHMVAHLDRSGHCLLLSDINRRAVYLLEIDSIDNGHTALFKSVQEFHMEEPLLSFAIESVTDTDSVDNAHTILIRMYTITNNAFQKMRVTYISQGQRLSEINWDKPEREEVVRESLLTEVSPLSSLYCIREPPTNHAHHQLQHNQDTHIRNSVDDQRKMDTSCLPVPPPCVSNGNWVGDNYPRIESRGISIEDKLIGDMIAIMEVQRRDMDNMMCDVEEMMQKRECHCRESRQIVWSDQAAKELGDSCEKVLSEILGCCLRDVMEEAMARICGDMGKKIGMAVDDRVTVVDPLIRDLLREIMHDKKFTGFLAAKLAESMEIPLRAVYVDMVRKELVPSLARTMDKVYSDTQDLYKDGMKEVMKVVGHCDPIKTNIIEEKIGAVANGCHQGMVVKETELLSKTLMAELAKDCGSVKEAIKKYSRQVTMINDALGVIKECGPRGQGHVITNTSISSDDCVERLMAGQDYAGAIDQALSLTNLRILIPVCSRIPPKSVLSCSSQKPSRLHSSSILALIQQLSHDFNDKLDLKIEYLFDATLSLNINDPIICVHVAKVIAGVVRRLRAHMAIESNTANKDKIALLLRLVTSVVDRDQ